MVESIGSKPLTGGERSVARIAATTPVQPAAQPLAQAPDRAVEAEPSATSSIALARTMAAAAPINEARVAAVKKAVANGTFPILPATVADRLLAVRYEWLGNDQA